MPFKNAGWIYDDDACLLVDIGRYEIERAVKAKAAIDEKVRVVDPGGSAPTDAKCQRKWDLEHRKCEEKYSHDIPAHLFEVIGSYNVPFLLCCENL